MQEDKSSSSIEKNIHDLLSELREQIKLLESKNQELIEKLHKFHKEFCPETHKNSLIKYAGDDK